MNILMLTNTYAPHVGGVARSVEAFAHAFRARGHRVLVVAPDFPGMPAEEPGVVRVPALQRFNGTDFSVPLPIPGYLRASLIEFEPQIVHAHHPFLLGDTALRIGANRDVPIVFTHHTRYEQYTHYVPGDSLRLKRFIIDLSVGYANLVDAVIAPSESIARSLVAQGVTTPVTTIPTGVDLDTFHPGDPSAARARFGLPRDAVVVGHLGRLAPEKNLEFLARAVARAMRRDPRMRFLVAGAGPSLPAVRRELAAPALRRRLHAPGPLSGPALVAAYQAMDVFAFASHSETQGMVLAEAMACGVPVVAVDADGVREVVLDGVNGRSIARDDTASFADALCEIAALSPHDVARLSAGALATAARMSITRCADEALALYATLVGRGAARRAGPDSLWAASMRRIRREVQILSNMAGAASDALLAP